MKVKSNVRAGSGSNSVTSSSTTGTVDTSTQTQKQSGGKPTNTVVYYAPAISRCVGI